MISDQTGEGLLAGKVVLVTGASSGIGAEAARVFARKGARVVLTARTAKRLDEVTRQITTEGGVASYVAGDISTADDVGRIIDTVLNRHDRLDGAFNNAGISQGGAALADVEEERFDRVSRSTSRASGCSHPPRSRRTPSRGITGRRLAAQRPPPTYPVRP